MDITPQTDIISYRDKVSQTQVPEVFGTQMGGMQLNATSTQIGGGNDIFKIDSQKGIHLGAASFADAPFSVDLQGNLHATSGTFSGDITGATGTFNGSLVAGSIDIGGSDSTSFHVDSDGNMWLGAGTFNIATNPFAVSNAGVVRAISGTIGGFTLGTTTLTATNLTFDSSEQRITLGSSNDVVIMDADDATYRLWIGNATAASAPFNVTKAGVVTASSIVITTANSTINGSAITVLQPRAENLYTTNVFLGSKVDGLSTTVTVGGITRDQINTQIVGGSGGAGGIARLYTAANLGFRNVGGNVISWDQNIQVIVGAKIQNGTTNDMFIGLLDNTVSPASTNGVLTTRHIGFFVKQDNTLIASCADGTTQSTGSVSGVTQTDDNVYRIVWTAATSALFYVNDVLKATLTSNIPSGTTNPPDLHFMAQQGAAGTQAIMLIKNNYQVIITL